MRLRLFFVVRPKPPQKQRKYINEARESAFSENLFPHFYWLAAENVGYLSIQIPTFWLFYKNIVQRHSPNKLIITVIIHQTHYEKSDWSRALNQFTIACELDMINAISAADIAFIMSSSTSAWLLSPLECFPQKQNG